MTDETERADGTIDADDTLSVPRSEGPGGPGAAAGVGAEPDDATVVVRRAAAAEPDDATVVVPRRRDPRPPAPAAAPVPVPEEDAARPWNGVALTRVYGPRSARHRAERAGIDEVQQRVGAPPGAGADALPERALLPSLARRARRSRIVTLSAYAATVALSLLGLWGVARLAFG